MSKASDYAATPKPGAPEVKLTGAVNVFVTDNGGLMLGQGDVRIYIVPADAIKLRDWLTDTFV